MCESSNSVGKGRSKEITLDIKCKNLTKMTMMMMKDDNDGGDDYENDRAKQGDRSGHQI